MVFHAGFKFLNFPPWFQGVTSMNACLCAMISLLFMHAGFKVFFPGLKGFPPGFKIFLSF